MNNIPKDRRVFVGEYLCGGGMLDKPVESIPASLLGEGVAMWRSLVEDLSQWAAVRTPVDSRLRLDANWNNGGNPVEFVTAGGDSPLWHQWIELCRDCDAAILVIPETDGLLTKGIAMLRSAGIDVLAPAPTTIGMASDKWMTAKWLHRHSIAHPKTWLIDVHKGQTVSSSIRHVSRELSDLETDQQRGYVVKPRDGCGGTDIRHYDSFELAVAALQSHEILQSHLIGRAASVLVVGGCEVRQCSVLPAVWQTLGQPTDPPKRDRQIENASSGDLGAFGFCNVGGIGPAPTEIQFRAHALVDRLLSILPGNLCGFLGIDLVMGDSANHDAIIEINPRLTTSYLGLRRMTNENLTQRLFRSFDCNPHVNVPAESEVWTVSG